MLFQPPNTVQYCGSSLKTWFTYACNMCLPQQTRELSITLITNIAIFSLRPGLKVAEIQCGVTLGGGGADAWRCAGM